MSGLDLGFLGRLVRDKDIRIVWERGITPDKIRGHEREIFEFVQDYYKRYSAVPSQDVIRQKFDVELPDVSESIEYFTDEILNRELHDKIKDLGADVEQCLTKKRSREALEKLRNFVRESNRTSGGKVKIQNVFSLVDQIRQDYLDAKAGKFGIKTPWELMDEWTIGWLS